MVVNDEAWWARVGASAHGVLRPETAAGLDAAQGWHEAVIDLKAVTGVDAVIVLTVRW
jgi:hypothetical protein